MAKVKNTRYDKGQCSSAAHKKSVQQNATSHISMSQLTPSYAAAQFIDKKKRCNFCQTLNHRLTEQVAFVMQRKETYTV